MNRHRITLANRDGQSYEVDARRPLLDSLRDLGVDLVVYHGWTGDLVGYDEGGVRSLYVRPIRWIDGEPTLVDGNGG